MSSTILKLQARKVILVYVIATIVSYIYIYFNRYYNGDFIKRELLISSFELTIITIFTLLPLIYIYWLFKKFCIKEEGRSDYSITRIRNLAWFFIIIHICLRISGYGTMGSDSVGVSANPFSILRAVLFKTPILPWVVIYVLGSNYKKGILITLGLFCVFSLVNKSLGGIFSALLLALYRYPQISYFFKRHLLITICFIICVPAIISTGYNIRDTLRSGSGIAETSYVDLVGGKLCGRLSSLSNNAYIYQNIINIISLNDEIPNAFFYYDPLHYFGIRPEFKSTGSFVHKEITHGKNDNYSIMAGIGGVLVISTVKGPLIVILNLLFIIIVPYLLFILTKRIGLRDSAGVALFLSIWFSVNGDSSDIANNIYYLLFIWIVLQFCKIRSHGCN